jgi:hypothetical protein
MNFTARTPSSQLRSYACASISALTLVFVADALAPVTRSQVIMSFICLFLVIEWSIEVTTKTRSTAAMAIKHPVTKSMRPSNLMMFPFKRGEIDFFRDRLQAGSKLA